MDGIILRDVERDMERFWEDVWGLTGPDEIRYLTTVLENEPKVDVYRADDHFTLVMELPGLGEKDFDVQVKSGTLTISGKFPERKREGETLVRREAMEGEFSRSFDLPEDVDFDRIEAGFKNGVLELKLPRSEKAPEKHVKVEVH